MPTYLLSASLLTVSHQNFKLFQMTLHWFSIALPLLLTTSVHSQCASGDNSIGDLCYVVVNQQLSYQDAVGYCHGISTSLAVVHTTLQANFLASTIRTKTGTSDSLFWIGLSRASSSSRFTWDDGSVMYWSNFDLNFPKDNNIVAESVINGKWRTLAGQQKLVFACSYNPNNVNPASTTPTYSTDASSSTYAPYSTYATDSSTAGYGSSATPYSTDSTTNTYGPTDSSASPYPTDSSTSSYPTDSSTSPYSTGSTTSYIF